jgi:hypothetical protein
MKWILLFFIVLPGAAAAQVEVVKDHRLDLLLKKQEELNRKVYMDNNRTGPGYRILVVSTNDRQKAIDVKTKLMREFPSEKTYLIYQSPVFKIQIGNYKSRQDADALYKKIQRIYPTGVIVIPSTIEMKPEEELSLN